MDSLFAPGVQDVSSAPMLGGDDVHLWWWPLHHERSDSNVGLDPQEQAVAAAFHRAGDRNAYVQSHQGLRRVLSCYSGVAPERVRLARLSTGKPVFANDVSLHFNLSHTAGYAVCAVTRIGPIGVDIEAMRPLEDLAAIGPLSCTAPEWASLLQREPAERERAFLQLWVRKEARLKAGGEGLLAPLADCHVGAGKHVPGQWREVVSLQPGDVWLLTDCDAPPGFVAAVAVTKSLRWPTPPRSLWLTDTDATPGTKN